MLHGYCIRAASDPGPAAGFTGVDGAAVTRLDADGLQIWVSRVNDDSATLERLRAHERVVRQALSTATPLPLRFGTRFSSVADARSALTNRGEEFRSELERFRDQVEMSVRVGSPPIPVEAAPEQTEWAGSPGRAFLQRRRAELETADSERREARRILESVAEALADLALPTVVDPRPGPLGAGSLAHLVHRGALRPYRSRIQALRRSRPDLRITLSGPWAPYSFVQR